MNGRTAIGVAVIGVFSAGVTGVLTNWDKIFGSRPAPQMAANAAPTASPGVARDSDVAEPAEAQAQFASASVPNITGDWNDQFGQTFQIRQQGSAIGLVRIIDGIQVFGAEGRLEGHIIQYRFRALIGTAIADGGCRGMVRSENLIEGDCAFDSGMTGPLRLTR